MNFLSGARGGGAGGWGGGEHNTMLKACIVPLTAYCMVGEKAVRPQHTGEKKPTTILMVFLENKDAL